MNKQQRRILIIGVILFLIYWLFFRKKQKVAYADVGEQGSWIEDMYGSGGVGYYGWSSVTGEESTGDGTEGDDGLILADTIAESRPPSSISLGDVQFTPSKTDDDNNQIVVASAYGGIKDAVNGLNGSGIPVASGTTGKKVNNLMKL